MSEREAKETRELLEAGWEQRGAGPKAIWRRPYGGRWTSRYQALIERRGGGSDSKGGPAAPGEDAP
jgi:hypothetical protein